MIRIGERILQPQRHLVALAQNILSQTNFKESITLKGQFLKSDSESDHSRLPLRNKKKKKKKKKYVILKKGGKF